MSLDIPPYYFLSCFNTEMATNLRKHRITLLHLEAVPSGQWLGVGTFLYEDQILILATASPHTKGKAVMPIFCAPSTSMFFTTQAARVWIEGKKNSPAGTGTSTSCWLEKSLLPFAGTWVMSAGCCFSLLKGTRSSADRPVTLTFAAPSLSSTPRGPHHISKTKVQI